MGLNVSLPRSSFSPWGRSQYDFPKTTAWRLIKHSGTFCDFIYESLHACNWSEPVEKKNPWIKVVVVLFSSQATILPHYIKVWGGGGIFSQDLPTSISKMCNTHFGCFPPCCASLAPCAVPRFALTVYRWNVLCVNTSVPLNTAPAK